MTRTYIDIKFHGCIEKDSKWNGMVKAWYACKAAKTEIPLEVDNYFNGNEPDRDGGIIELEPISERTSGLDESVRYRIDLKSLSKDIEFLDVEILKP